MRRPFVIAVIAMFSFASFVGCAGKGAEKRERIAASANGKGAADDGKKDGNGAAPADGKKDASTEGNDASTSDSSKESHLVENEKRDEVQAAYQDIVNSLESSVDSIEDLKNSQLQLKQVVVLINQKEEQSGSSQFISLSTFDMTLNSEGRILPSLNKANSKTLGTFKTDAESAKRSLFGLSALFDTTFDDKGHGVAKDSSSLEIQPSINTNSIVLGAGELKSELIEKDLYSILKELNSMETDKNGFKSFASEKTDGRIYLVSVRKSKTSLGVQIEEGGDIDGNLIQSLFLKYDLKEVAPSEKNSDKDSTSSEDESSSSSDDSSTTEEAGDLIPEDSTLNI
ncbi:MAG: hypothetical protein GW917_02140 [Bdellovibrionales bacterium]|nr:hypothetical protein [Bdellovibrionales bacterium]